MPIFRIEKQKDFTIMSNHHLRNKSLSLKAKGLQSLMISLPDLWSYSLKGLAKISRDGVESIGTALQELEKQGYLTRRQVRDDRGKFLDLEYTIHEIPVTSADDPVDNSKPEPKRPDKDNPQPGNPDPGEPDSEKYRQSSIKNKVCNNQKSFGVNINPSIREEAPVSGQDKEIDSMDAIDIYRDILKENIGYECLREQYSGDELDEILELMLEAVCSAKKTIRIGGEDKPAALVKGRFLKIDQFHIEYVLDSMRENTTEVRNIKGYLLTAIYNAPSTIGNYYKSRVNHDFYGSK